MRNFNSLSNFQICSTTYSVVNCSHFAVPYIPELIYLIAGCFYLLTTFTISPIPSPPHPMAITNLFCIYEFRFFFLIPHISEIIQYSPISVCPISFSMMPSKLIHVKKKKKVNPCHHRWQVFLLFMAE